MDPTLHEIQRALGRIEGKLDNIAEDIKDHGDRLWTLEKWQSKMVGIAAAVSAGISYFVGIKV